MTDTFDVAVVGGGMAGAAASIALSQQGIDVLWASGHQRQMQVPVGDSLAPAAGPLLRRLGLHDLLNEPAHRAANTTFSSWGTPALVERNAIVHLEGPGHVVDRGAVQRVLHARASESARSRGETFSQALAADGLWQFPRQDGSHAKARFLIDATGRRATLSRRLSKFRRLDHQVAAVATLPHRDSTVEPTPATLLESVEQGWWYAALKADGRLSLMFFSDPDLLPEGLSRDLAAWRRLVARTHYVARWVDDAGFGMEEPPRLAAAATTWLEPPCGRTPCGAPWAAIGDAAAAFDPLSSHGMTSALWSALRVADLTPDVLAGDGRALDDYAKALHDGVHAFQRERLALYGRERRFPQSVYWRRRQR